MSRRVTFLPRATETLERLYLEIAAAASPETALRYAGDIYNRCGVLGEFTMIGVARGDLRGGLRVLSFGRRVTIAYEVAARRVLIVPIFLLGQDFEGALGDEGPG
jgi:toxin ParE1/3/4